MNNQIILVSDHLICLLLQLCLADNVHAVLLDSSALSLKVLMSSVKKPKCNHRVLGGRKIIESTV